MILVKQPKKIKEQLVYKFNKNYQYEITTKNV